MLCTVANQEVDLALKIVWRNSYCIIQQTIFGKIHCIGVGTFVSSLWWLISAVGSSAFCVLQVWFPQQDNVCVMSKNIFQCLGVSPILSQDDTDLVGTYWMGSESSSEYFVSHQVHNVIGTYLCLSILGAGDMNPRHALLPFRSCAKLNITCLSAIRKTS